MGDWAIVIQGTGVHHNKNLPEDADRMTDEFVSALIRAGHQVRHASFTSGGRMILAGTGSARVPTLGEEAEYREIVAKLDAAKLAAAALSGEAPKG